MRRRDLIAAAAGALTATVLAGSVAWAAIPGDGGVIQGCYTKIGGILRVIDIAKGQKCHATLEVPITWNQAGQLGPQGIQGVPGPPGPAGEDGTSGLAGQSCPVGSQVVGFDATGDIVCNDGAAPPPPPPPPDCLDNPLNVFYNGVCYQVWHVYELAAGNPPPFDRGVLLEDLLVTSIGGSTITASLSPPDNPLAPNDVEIELGGLFAPALESRVNVLGTVLAMASDGSLAPGLAARLQAARLDVLSGP